MHHAVRYLHDGANRYPTPKQTSQSPVLLNDILTHFHF